MGARGHQCRRAFLSPAPLGESSAPGGCRGRMSASEAPCFTSWLDDFFTSYYRRRPVNATFVGIRDYDELLPDCSESGSAALASYAEALLARLWELPDEALTTA